MSRSGRPSRTVAPKALVPWPSVDQLLSIGFVPCSVQPCGSLIDPVNVPERTCLAHRPR